MELILDDEVWRHQVVAKRIASTRLRGTVEAVGVEPVRRAKEARSFAYPGQGGELVDSGDQESGQLRRRTSYCDSYGLSAAAPCATDVIDGDR
jgi:hypothetical protein